MSCPFRYDKKVEVVPQSQAGSKKAAHSCFTDSAAPDIGVEVLSRNDDDTHPLRVQKSAISSCFTGRRLRSSRQNKSSGHDFPKMVRV